MAYFYIDDGFPESEDYENNYIYFNAEDPECLQKMIQLAQTLGSVSFQERRAIVEKFTRGESRCSVL
ncbi:hypothetical protein L0Z72_16600 [candidate division KSB1 bacterium]|nr:hypothetical protein [candidate division KSB1 bacterium]